MNAWQAFIEAVKTYQPPDVVKCRFCGAVVPHQERRGGQPVLYCNDQCRLDASNKRKYSNEYQRKLALRTAQAA